MKIVFAGIAVVFTFMCGCKSTTNVTSKVSKNFYGMLSDGSKANIYELKNKNGIVAKVTDFGAILVGISTPDRDGKMSDITHGYDTLQGWEKQDSYMGATAGRFANRIAKGKFSLDGEDYTLATNNGENHLHGGKKGFDKYLWNGTIISKPNAVGVSFTRISKDKEEGYPGNLTTTVTYMLTNDDELKVDFKATTDKTTIVNMVHHSYWNLSGDHSTSILDHELTLNASRFLPVDKGLIPTGELRPVKGTPFDFTKPRTIGEQVNNQNTQLLYGKGYDHCWCLDGKVDSIRKAASLYDPKSGRCMDIFTDQPGIQFYGGNFLDGSIVGKGDVKYNFRTALCLETERFPDSPNQKQFKSPVLKTGQIYRHTMIHKFYTK